MIARVEVARYRPPLTAEGELMRIAAFLVPCFTITSIGLANAQETDPTLCREKLPVVQAIADAFRQSARPGGIADYRFSLDGYKGDQLEAMKRFSEAHDQLVPLLKAYAVDAANAASELRQCASR